MNKNLQYATCLSIIFVIILPFAILSFYNLPNLEDYAESIIPEVWWHVKFLYLTYDGRYFASFLFAALNPLKHHCYLGYQFISVGLFVSLYTALFFFVKTYIKSLNIINVSIFSGLILVFFVLLNPTIPFSFYYMISSYIYMVPSILFILLLVSLKLLGEQHIGIFRFIFLFLSVAFIAAISGGNEMLLIPIFFALTFTTSIFNKRLFLVEILALWLTFFSSVFIVFTSPGLSSHFEFTNSESISLNGVFVAAIKTVNFSFQKLVEWVFNPSFWIYSVLIFYFLLLIKNKLDSSLKRITKNDMIFIIVFYSFYFFFFVFPYVWGTGESARTSYNQAFIIQYLYFVSGWIVILCLLVVKLPIQFSNWFQSHYLSRSLVLLMIFGLFFLNNNVNTAYNDLLSGEAKQYYSELNANIIKSINAGSGLQNGAVSLCILEAQPLTIYSGVYFSQNDEAFHGQYKIFYNLKNIEVKDCKNE
jgi:hypothetical protein